MNRRTLFTLLAACAVLGACATNRAEHPLVKAADRVIDDITGTAPVTKPESTTLAAKPQPAQP